MGKRSLRSRRSRWLAAASMLGFTLLARATPAAEPCANGAWLDVMLGSYHIHPYRQFDEFDPGIGAECWFSPRWAAAAGYFRNSLDRPSLYGGLVWAPESFDWRWIRLAGMGGIISGYNFGHFGIGGANNRTGPLVAPALMTHVGRFGVNFILIPPIPQDNLPFTVGFQGRYRWR